MTDAVREAEDHWIRAEITPDWPVDDALKVVHKAFPKLRVGVLRPFAASDIAKLNCTVSEKPPEITRWRNQSIASRRNAPTVVLGEARGREEAGLRAAPRVVTDDMVIDRWQMALQKWLQGEIHSQAPRPLFGALFQKAKDGAINSVWLDDFVTFSLSRSEPLNALRSELWRLNLIPDDRVLDTGRARDRLELNIQTRELLVSASDTPGDLKSLARLEAAVDEGSKTAQKALKYRSLPQRRHLQGLALDSLLEITSPRSRSQPANKQPLDLFEFLDKTAGAGLDLNRETVAALAKEWDLDAQDKLELVAAFSLPGGTPAEILIEVVPTNSESVKWTASGNVEEQVLALVADSQATRDWLAPGSANKITGQSLLEATRAQDAVIRTPVFENLAKDYLVSRAALNNLEAWLRESAFPLLLLNPQAREVVRDFLGAWQALVDAARQVGPGEADVIRQLLILLEAMWGKRANEEVAEWCVLGPLHPYVLDPILRLAEYSIEALGAQDLGKKVSWALDKSLPAYRVLWALNSTLLLARRNGIFEYASAPGAHHPPATSGDGIQQIARAFLGFYPFARDVLTITLVDPPKGGAVPSNLRRLRGLVNSLRVYLVSTSGDTAQLEELGDLVVSLGRFTSLDEWHNRSPVRSHLLFYFLNSTAGTPGAVQAGWGPTPGAHVALKIQLKSPPLTPPDRLLPYLSFEPREGNKPVIAIQQLAETSTAGPRLFEVQPMLSDSQIVEFAKATRVSDWAVLVAPSPLGLIVPRSPGHELTYLGRERLGVYGMYVYATSLFAVRKFVTEQLRPTPTMPEPVAVEKRLTELAVQSPNGVLRIGRVGGTALWEQVGVIVSSALTGNEE